MILLLYYLDLNTPWRRDEGAAAAGLSHTCGPSLVASRHINSMDCVVRGGGWDVLCLPRRFFTLLFIPAGGVASGMLDVGCIASMYNDSVILHSRYPKIVSYNGYSNTLCCPRQS
ncbi:hypothetical protein AMATHDRAFT_64361 [Amanita thiersii Skay4041]|uniref:Uncharacterized protein n=1 Tax=Amanita thiersii Skay4041 TaxID=703135 RepID=A0A2A9NHV8_9AGAR|nr:hypothetical protein AMATHDRAFT_64361 [Amanita thiersii Skay4041]